jgi:catechol 2,3-dioxygenase-like lactoylglutathione lyase family enzyme
MDKPIKGIDTVLLRVSDIESSRKWYAEKLRFPVLMEAAEINLVVLDTGGPVSLTLWQTADKIEINPSTTPFPIFSTTDAALSRMMLQAAGVNVGELSTDQYVTSFQFFDPDGNLLEACQVH